MLTVCFFFALHVASSTGAQAAPAPFDEALFKLSIALRLNDFAKGVVDTAHVVFFAATSIFFLVLTVLSVESRRWR